MAHALHASHQGIDLFLGVIERERCTHRAFYAQSLHEWLRTVVSCAHGNAQAIEQRAHVEMMDISHQKRDYGSSLFGLSNDAHARNGAKLLQRIVGQCGLIGSYLLHADLLYIVQRCREARSAHKVGQRAESTKEQDELCSHGACTE